MRSPVTAPVAWWAYRIRQASKAWRGPLSAAQQREVAGVLSPPLFKLFLSMAPMGQRHGYDVYNTLRAHGAVDPDLLAAGLLHDVGKGRLGLAARTIWVLVGVLSPTLRVRLAGSRPWGKILGLHANLTHSQTGAAAVRDAGGSRVLVRLVRDHKLPANGDAQLAALQLADDMN